MHASRLTSKPYITQQPTPPVPPERTGCCIHVGRIGCGMLGFGCRILDLVRFPSPGPGDGRWGSESELRVCTAGSLRWLAAMAVFSWPDCLKLQHAHDKRGHGTRRGTVHVTRHATCRSTGGQATRGAQQFAPRRAARGGRAPARFPSCLLPDKIPPSAMGSLPSA